MKLYGRWSFQYMNELIVYNFCRRLGWNSKSGEDHSSSLLRGEVFQALSAFDHDETQQEALRRFQIWLDDSNTSLLSANTRMVKLKLRVKIATSLFFRSICIWLADLLSIVKAAYLAVMRNTTNESRTGLESLLSFYKRTDVLQEKERILRMIQWHLDWRHFPIFQS